MKEKINFNKFSNTPYQERINDDYHTYQKKIKQNTIITFLIIIIITLLPSIFFIKISRQFPAMIAILILYDFSFIFYFLYANESYIFKESYKINEKIIQELLLFISDNQIIDYSKDSRISKSDLEKCHLFDLETLQYQGQNFIKAKYHNHNIFLGDVQLFEYYPKVKKKYIYSQQKKFIKTYITYQKKEYFRGIYFGSEMKKKNNTYIYLVPRKKIFIKNILNHFVYTNNIQMKLENLELAKEYKIYSNNEIQARYILSMNFMEQLSHLSTIFQGDKYIVFKPDGRFSIFIEDFSIESLKEKRVPYSQKKFSKYIDTIFCELIKIFSIYDLLK